MRFVALLLTISLSTALHPFAVRRKAPQPTPGIRGTVRARDTGLPLPYATVEIVDLGLAVAADDSGRYRFGRVPDGRFEVRASALGYRAMSRRIEPSEPRESLEMDFSLRPEPIRLRPLTVRTRRGQAGGEAERALYEREVAPALVGVSGQEIRDVPAFVEADVLRSLQVLPGVLPLNDLSAELHVQGGAADQNVYLWDGVRIFAPYHMFGMFGAFNPDAVGRVDFYRGYFPARYGGALSSVIDVAPPVETADTLLLRGGVSLLGGRIAGRGQAGDGAIQWMAAGRVTHTALLMDRIFSGGMPYGFHDLQARATVRISDSDQLGISGFTSQDRFRMFLGDASGVMTSHWRNGAGKLQWNGQRGRQAYTASIWTTGYGGAVRMGGASGAPESTDAVHVTGLSASMSRPGEGVGLRLGVDMESGSIRVDGNAPIGGYVEAAQHARYLLFAGYGALEAQMGSLRATSGLRIARETETHRTLVEPRLSARFQVAGDWAVTLGAARTHQFLSGLEDDRYVMPGPPFWFLHPEGAPASRADNVSASLDGWRGTTWSLHLDAYARRLHAVPVWQPVGARTLDQVRYEDGTARGAGVMIRRHQGTLTGWLGYTYSIARLRQADGGDTHAPAWDRPHAADGALFYHLNDRVTLSTRVIYGSGPPFWPPVGVIDSQRFSPLEGALRLGESYPVWGDRQLRMADYFRLDGSVRGRFNLGRLDLEVFASLLNLRERANVLYYKLREYYDRQGNPSVELVPEHIAPVFPSIGFNLWF